jgi:hypothetical protein
MPPAFVSMPASPEFLRQQKSGDGAAIESAFKQVQKSFAKPQQVELVKAIYQRIAWIEEHRDDLSEPARWQGALARRAKVLYRGKLPFSEADLRALLAAHRSASSAAKRKRSACRSPMRGGMSWPGRCAGRQRGGPWIGPPRSSRGWSRRSVDARTAIPTIPGRQASTARRGACASTIFPTSPMYGLMVGDRHIGDFHDWSPAWQRA